MLKVQSGISGELEPLRRLGYALDVATLQQVAYNHGITESINTMTQAQKSQLRYVAIMEQSGNAMGDLSRTILTPANSLRILQQQITQLTRALGNLLIPFLIKVIPYVQAFVEVLTEAIQALANLVGFELPSIDYSGLGGLTSGAEDAESALGDAADAAKKLKDYTLGIDELNIISPDTSTSSGTGSVGGSYNLPIDLPEYDFLGDIQSQTDELKEKMRDLLYNYVIPIGSALLAWKIASSLIPDLGIIAGLIGSAMVGIGITLLVDSIKDVIINKKLTWNNILKGAAGGAVAGGGLGLMLAKTMGLKWYSGMLIGAVVGIGISLSIMAITSEIVSGLNFENAILGALGGAVAGGGIGAGIAIKIGGSLLSGTAIGVVIGAGLMLSIMGIASQFTEGTNVGNFILTEIGTMITGAGIGFAIGGPAGALIGLTIAAAIGLSLTITSINFEEGEKISEMVHSIVFDGIGVPLVDISQQFSDFAASVVSAYQPIIDMGEALEESRTKTQDAFLEIQNMSSELGLTSAVTQEEINNMIASFQSLYQGIESNMSQSTSIVQSALVDALKNATPEVSEQIDVLIGEYNRYVRETQGRAAELKSLIEQGYQDLYGFTADSPEYQETMSNINNWYAELGDLSGGMSDVSWNWKQTVQDVMENGIDLGAGTEEAVQQVKDISAAGQDALNAVGEARNAVLKEIDRQIEYASKYRKDDLPILYDIREQIENDYANQESEIKSEIESVFKRISDQMGSAASEVYNSALENYDFNWFEQIWKGDKNDYARQSVAAFQGEIVDPLSDAISEAANSLGLDSESIGMESINGMITGMINQYTIENPPEILREYGSNTVEGFANGIQDNLPKIELPAKGISDAVTGTVTKELGIHSPSTVMEGYGKNVDQGFANGIEKNKDIVYDSMVVMLNPLLTLMEQFANRVQSVVSEMLNNIASSIESATITENGTVSFDSSPKVHVSKFAMGGFPEHGQLFIANEAGPELVGKIGNRTAVANSDQIEGGIQRGVEEANTSMVSVLYQILDAAERIAAKDNAVYIGDEEIGTSANRYNSNRGYNLGITT